MCRTCDEHRTSDRFDPEEGCINPGSFTRRTVAPPPRNLRRFTFRSANPVPDMSPRCLLAMMAILSLSGSGLAAQDHSLGWSFSETARLGTVMGDPNQAFHDLPANAIASTSDGKLLVLDRGNSRIQVFTADGTFIRSIGEEGDGPGQFRNPVSIWVEDERSIGVFDWALNRVSRFALDGELLEDRSVPFGRDQKMVRSPRGELFAQTIGLRPRQGAADSTVQRLNLVSGTDTTVLARLALEPIRYVRFTEPCRFGIDITPLFEPWMPWAVRGDIVAVNDTYAYRVRLYASDGSRRLIERPIDPIRLTREDALREIGNPPRMPNPRGAVCGRFDADVILRKRGFYPYWQVVDAIRITPDGRVWVRRTAAPSEDDAGPIDIFDGAGEYMGTLPPSFPFPDAFLSDTMIARVERGEFDEYQVAVYRIGK